MNLNRVVLIGRLTKDPELRQVSNGNETVSFTLAVTRQFAPQGAEKQTDFIACVAWGNQAKFLGNYMKKGSLISVEGRIQTRNYEVEGRVVYVTEVVTDNIQSLEPKQNLENIPNQQVSQPRSNPAPQDPFAPFDDSDAYYQSSKDLTVDDDLPF